MITVAEIRKKADRIYPEVLRSILTGEAVFPKIIRADKSLSKDFAKMNQEIAQIMADSKDRKGFGYTVQSEPVKTKLHSIQDIPSAIVFETLIDYLKFIGKKSEFERFVEQVQNIITLYPQLKDCLFNKPELVIANIDNWIDLLKVCDWFLNSFEVNKYYIRELPISVHTKFIEENKTILRILLDELIPNKLNRKELVFEKRFHLKYAQPIIRFRYLGKKNLPGIEYSDISIPLEQFIDIPLICRKIIIIENLMNFLTFPHIENVVAVWGKGFAIDSLKHVLWLKNKKLFYWSDLDIQGFQMLSQLRSYFPETQAFLMDSVTLNSYKDFWVKGTPANIKELNFLNDNERSTFFLIKENNIRLEQERILQSEIIETTLLKLSEE